MARLWMGELRADYSLVMITVLHIEMVANGGRRVAKERCRGVSRGRGAVGQAAVWRVMLGGSKAASRLTGPPRVNQPRRDNAGKSWTPPPVRRRRSRCSPSVPARFAAAASLLYILSASLGARTAPASAHYCIASVHCYFPTLPFLAFFFSFFLNPTKPFLSALA